MLLTPSGLPVLSGVQAAALEQARSTSEGQRASLRQVYLDAATADLSGGARTTGVRWWLKFCVYGRTTSPVTHLDAGSSLADKLEAEQLLMDFVLWLALCRPSGRPVSARSIAKYVSQV